MSTDVVPIAATRRAPALGGFNLTFLYLELRRLLRNRRTLLVSLVAPIAILLLFRTGKRTAQLGPDFAALTTVGIAVYGAMAAATAGGAMVSVERALGWSRQLRLTPLSGTAYIAVKLLLAMTLGLLSVVAVFVVSAIEGVQMPLAIWLESALLAWLGALVFAALGLFAGYLLPSENVMQIIGPVLAGFALLGGLFVPVKLLPTAIQDVAPYVPTYGVAEIARYPLTGGSFDVTWVLNVAAWTLLFAAGAVVLFRRDTRRT